MMKTTLKKAGLPLAGALVGAIAGFLYWKWIGCSSGTCMITSKPLNSSLYFAGMGALLFSMFRSNKQKAS